MVIAPQSPIDNLQLLAVADDDEIQRTSRNKSMIRRVSSQYWLMVIQKWLLIEHAPGAQDDVDVKAKKVEQVLGTEVKPAAEGAVPAPLLNIFGRFQLLESEWLVPNMKTPPLN